MCPIAEGGMASVWIARQSGKHGFEKFVAVKTVLPKYASDARFQQMFQDEARIASRIEHANVAQILDVGEQNEITYLVMEYVDGESLSTIHRALSKKGMKVPPGIVLRILADVCGGLHTAHELREDDGALLGVVHRDVSPQNVLVSNKGVAKLIDFGIAKARDRIAGDTASGQVKGKIRYMAPEQAVGKHVDRRADLWAVGAILYHLVSGKPPYDGENDVQALMVLTSGRPPVPLPPGTPPAIVSIVKRALTADMDQRFSTAAEMQQAIEDAMIEAGLQTRPAQIAAFLAEHVAERTKKRKEAIAVGMKAAGERERYAEIMRSNLRVTGSGVLSSVGQPGGEFGPGTGPGVGSRPGFGTNPGQSASRNGQSNPGHRSAPGEGSRNGVASSPGQGSRSGAGSNPGGPGGNSVVTGGTLGSAAMDVGGITRGSRGRTVALVGGAAAGVLALAAVVLVLTRGPGDHPDAQATAATSASPAAAPPPAAPTPPTPATVVTVTTPWTAAPTAPTAPVAPATAEPEPAAAGTTATIAASALRPAAPPPVAVAPPQPPVAAQRPAYHPPAGRPGTKPKTRIDDGF
ncbi:MAG TPA: serine/threonine-protein kinase [Polyangiaceae bacterium]|nr:serine/threonine-protein kinase [Polyangiaceae bacterium]